MRKLLLLLLTIPFLTWAQSEPDIKGLILHNSESVPFATIIIKKLNKGTSANAKGEFRFYNLPDEELQLTISAIGYQTTEVKVDFRDRPAVLNIDLEIDDELQEVEVFGNRFSHPDKIEALTRLPLEPYEQIQSISVISDKLIQQQGALSISEATRNVPGVYTFATYGNRSESISSRGFRGIPILKNGVRVHSDFRGTGILTDMQGVDNIQVLKGAASITQGVATDLGSPGGVVNIVTKTPKYQFGGEASMRVGSYGLVRPAFDVYGPLNEQKNIAFRINAALERKDSYRSGISGESFYINPSLEWKPDDKTEVTLEMDYFSDSRTPHAGTVNLAENDQNAIYDLPYDVFLGFENDRNNTENTTYAIRVNRDLSEKLSLRAAYYRSNLELDNKGASFGNVVMENDVPVYNQRTRGYGISTRSDKNSVVQFDLIGDEIETGAISHTFQVGFDYRTTNYETFSKSASAVDTIDVFNISNNRSLPQRINFAAANEGAARSKAIGFVAQDVITFTNWFKTFLGVRYSSVETITGEENNRSDSFNPLAGIIFSPFENVNLFASYTNSSYPRTAARIGEDGEELGNERYDQLEAGIKTNWLNSRLRFNLTLFRINNKNINLPVYDENWIATGFFQQGGNDQRQGIEVELTGRPLQNLEVIAGYSYIDAQYKDHTSFVYGSAPLNTPKHTFNTYANYSFSKHLEGLSLGGGVYHTGERPVNDWSAGAVTHQGIVPNQKPFDVESLTQVNLQAAYQIDKNWNVRILANNIFDEIGYNAYRTRFINQTDPRTFSGVISYRF